jgi:AraC-like DNA-binding protein
MNISQRFILLLLITFFFITGCSGYGGGEPIKISNWHMCKNGAGIADPKIVKDCWQPYKQELPLNKNVLFFNVSGDETVWLKGDFTLQTLSSTHYGVFIRGRSRSEKVYVNSCPLEQHQDQKITNIYTPAGYIIPGNCINKGNNTIYIKTSLLAGFTAITENITILDSSGYDRETLLLELIYTQFPLAILIYNFSLLFPALIFFFWNRRERVFASSALALFTFFLYILFEFIPAQYTGTVIPQIHLALLPILTIILYMSVQSLFRIYLSTFTWITGIVCLIASILILIVNKKISVIYSPYLLLSGVFTILPFSIIILSIINRTKRDRLLFIVIIIFIVLTGLFGAYEILTYITDSRYVFLSLIYISPLFVITFTVLTARKFMKSMIKMELLYNTIKKPEKKDKDPIITDNTEGKLNSVIAFINMNYTQDISREGLAGAIDISTDYMSRLFKTYTGKKINEYINELRIQEAMKKLQTKNIKIIDIALSVGFESLSTFNRAFKNVTGITPSEYRNQF